MVIQFPLLFFHQSKSHLHSTPQLGSDFYDAKQFDLPMKVKEMDTASLVASEISDAISAQKHEIIEKQKTVEMMKKAIVSVNLKALIYSMEVLINFMKVLIRFMMIYVYGKLLTWVFM